MHLIKTNDDHRRALWLRLFGRDLLPVKRPFPREVFYLNGRAEWLYDLDTAALSQLDRRSLAVYLASRQWGLTFQDALQRIERDGWHIVAADCELVTMAETAAARVPTARAGQGRKTAALPLHT